MQSEDGRGRVAGGARPDIDEFPGRGSPPISPSFVSRYNRAGYIKQRNPFSFSIPSFFHRRRVFTRRKIQESHLFPPLHSPRESR